MNNLTVNILDVYGLEIVGRYVGLPVNKVLTDVHPDNRHIPVNKLNTLTRLIAAGDEHASIMRQVQAHLLIRAPRYWWVQWDKYRYGVEMYSGSTMHTLLKCELNQDEDFTPGTEYSPVLALYLQDDNLLGAKANLPEGYLQTRLVLVSYQTLRRIWLQRRGHKLPEWAEFIRAMHKVPYADELIFIEPRNPWRALWTRVITLGPWAKYPRVYAHERAYCAYCGAWSPDHEPGCPYILAERLWGERELDKSTTHDRR